MADATIAEAERSATWLLSQSTQDPVAAALLCGFAEVVRSLGRIEQAIRESKPPVVYGGVQVASIPLRPQTSIEPAPSGACPHSVVNVRTDGTYCWHCQQKIASAP